MKEFLISQSIGSGALYVAAISVLFGVTAAYIKHKIIRLLFVIIMPFLIAYIFYWGPVWLGSNSSQYGSWSIIAIPPMYLAGLMAALISMLCITKYKNKN